MFPWIINLICSKSFLQSLQQPSLLVVLLHLLLFLLNLGPQSFYFLAFYGLECADFVFESSNIKEELRVVVIESVEVLLKAVTSPAANDYLLVQVQKERPLEGLQFITHRIS